MKADNKSKSKESHLKCLMNEQSPGREKNEKTRKQKNHSQKKQQQWPEDKQMRTKGRGMTTRRQL